MPSLPLYALRKSEVYEALETSPEGLSPQQAKERRALYGRNVLAEPPVPAAWRKWIGFIAHPMALLLWAAGGLAVLTGRVDLGLTIWVVVLINASFSFWRERRAGQAVAALKDLLPSYARLIRAGQEVKVPASEVVAGDVLALAEGDSIPADARLVEAYGLRTNHATLTGESLPSLRVADASLRDGLTEIERPNLVFAGTSVISGTGRAVVYATGMSTQFGRIANLTQTLKEGPSLIQAQLVRITRILALVALITGGIVFVVGINDVGISPGDAFILAIGIVVAAIPEGLAPTVTLTLAMAVQRLARCGVLVKKLSVVETLGAVSVICTDKSGTLTQNQMTVRKLWVAGQRLNVSGVGYEPKGEFKPQPAGSKQIHLAVPTADLKALCKAALLCNNARLVAPAPRADGVAPAPRLRGAAAPEAEEQRWTSLGDQTEAALKVLALKAGLDEPALVRAYPRLHELPFEAGRKRMSTIHQNRTSSVAFVKGAPHAVLQLCTHILKDGQVVALDEQTRSEILGTIDDFSRQALRVLALAQRILPPRSGPYLAENIECDLTFLGLAGMMDPPRPDITRAVQAFQSAGIRLVMITGDYGLTAESVARRVGMLTNGPPRILTGADLDGLSDADLQSILDEEVIFARMAPEHKVRLVGAFQAHGAVVGVMGDGVNDVPALRKADIGIAMGVTGTDVAKEAADVVLVRDDFSAIVPAIEEGRAVYDNLRKFITYIFASNVPEILPFILTALFNIPLALTVAQILAIDLGTDILPSLALGMEKPEPDVMQRPPRPRSQPLVDRRLLLRGLVWLGGLEAALSYAAFFVVFSLAGYPIIHTGLLQNGAGFHHVYLLATTAFQAGVVSCQIGNAFACRTEQGHVHRLGWLSNPILLLGIGAAVVMMLATVYIAPLARVFDHLPLPLLDWLGLALFAPILFGLEWVRKFITRRQKHSQKFSGEII
jgi:Ca2+-transporting ATPase